MMSVENFLGYKTRKINDRKKERLALRSAGISGEILLGYEIYGASREDI